MHHFIYIKKGIVQEGRGGKVGCRLRLLIYNNRLIWELMITG